MKQLSFIFLLLSILIENSYSQWPQVFGSEYYLATPNFTGESYDKGFLLTLNYKTQPSSPYGSCIIKTDINGNQLWKKEIGNNEKFLGIRGVAFDSQSNVYISGGTRQFDSERDPFIMKLNPCMEIEWCNIYRSLDLDDFADDIVYEPALNSLVVNIIFARNLNSIQIMNVNPDGGIIWSNYYCNNPDYSNTHPYGLVYSNSDTSILLFGTTYARIDTTSYFELQPYWLKIAHDGSFKWERYKLPDSVFSRGTIAEEPIILSQNRLLTGITDAHSESDGKLVQLSYTNGTFEWIKTLHEPDTASKCQVNSSASMNDLIYIGVQNFVTGYDPTGHGSLQKYDSLGNFKLEAVMPVNFTTVIDDICPTHDNKLMISATHSLTENDVMLIKYTEDLVYDSINTTPITYDSLCPASITSGIIELGCNIITSLKDQSKNGISKLMFAPNPAENYTIIYLPETIEAQSSEGLLNITSYRSDFIRELKIEAFNTNGQKIYSACWPDNIKEQILQVEDWNPGLYLIQIKKQNQTISTGKLLVK